MFEKSDFKSLSFPIYTIPQREDLSIKLRPHGLEDAIPSFYSLKKRDRNSMLRYVIYMYDFNSPIRKIRKLEDRKHSAANLAGFDMQKRARLIEIWGCADEKLVKMIIEFLTWQDDKVFALKAVNEEVFWQYQNTLLEPITQARDDKTTLQALEVKSKLMAESDKILERITSYESKIYGDDNLLKDAIKSKRQSSPEAIANV